MLLQANLTYYKVELDNAKQRRDNQAVFAQKYLQIGGRRAYASR